MHFSKLSLAIAAAHIVSFTAAYGYEEDSYSLYAREAEPEDDDFYYLSARDAEAYDDDDFYGLYAREALDDYDLYDLYTRGLMGKFATPLHLPPTLIADEDARLPGGPVSQMVNGVRGAVKANDALQRKHAKDAHNAMPSFHQRTGGQFLNHGSSHSGGSSVGRPSHSAFQGSHSSSHSSSGGGIVDQLKKKHGGSVFPH